MPLISRDRNAGFVPTYYSSDSGSDDGKSNAGDSVVGSQLDQSNLDDDLMQAGIDITPSHMAERTTKKRKKSDEDTKNKSPSSSTSPAAAKSESGKKTGEKKKKKNKKKSDKLSLSSESSDFDSESESEVRKKKRNKKDNKKSPSKLAEDNDALPGQIWTASPKSASAIVVNAWIKSKAEAKIMVDDVQTGDYERFFDSAPKAIQIYEVCQPEWDNVNNGIIMNGLIKMRIKKGELENPKEWLDKIYGLKRYGNLFECYRVEVYEFTDKQMNGLEPDLLIVEEGPSKRGRKRGVDGTPKKRDKSPVKTLLEKIQSFNWKEFDDLDLEDKPTLEGLLKHIGVNLDEAKSEYMAKKKEGSKGRSPAWFVGLSLYKKKLEQDV